MRGETDSVKEMKMRVEIKGEQRRREKENGG